MAETLLTHLGIIVGGDTDTVDNMASPRIYDRNAIAPAFIEATPKERGQIVAFTEANTAKLGGKHGYWFLIRCKNLDTGKQFLTAGYSLEAPGLSVAEFRASLGLTKGVNDGKVGGKEVTLPARAGMRTDGKTPNATEVSPGKNPPLVPGSVQSRIPVKEAPLGGTKAKPATPLPAKAASVKAVYPVRKSASKDQYDTLRSVSNQSPKEGEQEAEAPLVPTVKRKPLSGGSGR